MALPLPGSPGFVPLLLAHLAEQPSLHDFKPDPILFSTILLSLIVAKGGLIVDVETSKEGETSKRAQIKRVAAHIAAITCGIFGRTTHHAHLNDSCDPSSLPHHLIVPPHSHTCPTSSSSHVRPGSRRTPSSHTSHSGLRYVSAASRIDPTHRPGLPSRHSWRSHGSSSARVTPSITPKPSTLLSSHPLSSSPSELEANKQLGDAIPTLPEVLILIGLEETETPVWIKLVDILLRRKVVLPEERGEMSLRLPLGFFLIWVRDAQKADHPSYLIDQFFSSTSIYAPDISATPPEIPSSPLIPATYLANLTALLPYTHVHPPLRIHISNLVCAVSAHPRLKSTITGRVLLSFTEFVRAHRLLASPFRLPEGWEEALHHPRKNEYEPPPSADGPPVMNPRHVSMRGYGLGGGKGGVDTWGDKAGQEPDIGDLRKVKDDDEDGEQWYATPDNVVGVWQLCMRHRIKGRGEMEEVIWVLKRSAVDLGSESRAMTTERRQGLAEKVLDELITKV